MQKPLHTGRLVLTPEDPHFLPPKPALIEEKLKAIGFIQEKIPGKTLCYRLGEAFMRLVTFVGCSPSVRLEPGEEGEPFCYAAFYGPYSQPRLLLGSNTTPPRCAGCRTRVDHWRDALARNTPTATAQSYPPCPHCGAPLDPLTFNWRHSAGCGRLFLYVENIFPQEAIPSPELMNHMKEASEDHPWNYFYLQEG